jgi:hypothetical protein
MGVITAAVGSLPVAVGVVGIACAVAAILLAFRREPSSVAPVERLTATV